MGDANGGVRLLGRAIVPLQQTCPAMSSGGVTVHMRMRPSPMEAAFPIVVCEAEYDLRNSAIVGPVSFQPLPVSLSKVLVLGDSGCRIVYYQPPQECADLRAWPLRKIAAKAASLHPDLVIHLGDYHYRESACEDRTMCGEPIFGDNWVTWDREFFQDAAPLLNAAPWIMLRGNHEDCARAGTGWFFLLSPQAMPARGCANKTNPYYLNLGNVILGVLDTAHIGDSHAGYSTEEWSVNVKSVLTNMKKIAGTNATWLLMHHPVWVQTELLPDGEVTELRNRSRSRRIPVPTLGRFRAVWGG